jgi:DNA-binding MarR family transcriptional regulator
MAEQRYDLGAMFVQLGRALVAAEQPVLAELGVEMWDYVVLLALRDGPAQSQARLAERTGRDKTRLIAILDRLERDGQLSRTPDPADRRNRIVMLSDSGRDLVERTQRAIRRMERDLLAELPERDRDTFVGLLERVAELVVARSGLREPSGPA